MAKEESKKSTAKKSTTKKSTTTKPVKKTSTAKSETKKSAPKVTKVKEEKKEAKVPAIIQEENHFGRTILAAVLIVIIFLGGYLGIRYKLNSGDAIWYSLTEDEKAFKEEYESLNGTTSESGHKIKSISIDKPNHMEYITPEKAAEILDSGSGVIYFGFASCPWCRNLVPALVDAANATKLDKIYYVNIRPNGKADSDIRDAYTLDEKNKARKSKDAENSYYNIMLALANELREYVLTTDSGKTVSTGEKRLYAPTVVAVKDGELVGFHEGTVDSHEKDENGDLRDLTKDEETELFNSLSNIISKYLDSGCQDGC